MKTDCCVIIKRIGVRLMQPESAAQQKRVLLTVNGIHLTEYGYRALTPILDRALQYRLEMLRVRDARGRGDPARPG